MGAVARPGEALLASPIIAWEESPCLLCGNTDLTAVLEAPDALGAGLRFLIVACQRCGLCFTNPRPDEASIRQFYPAEYHCYRRERQSRSRLPLQPHGGARLLDFGCGAGEFLLGMSAAGWNVIGLDRDEASVDAIRAAGLEAHVGTLPCPLWRGPTFEAITMRQSLEHVHDPLDVLRAAHGLLTEDGVLYVSVPNFDSFGVRWFGPRWYGLDVPRHLTHFTPRTLNLMLNRAGFGNVQIWQERKSSWIRHSANGGVLATRIGSGAMGWWGRLIGRADAIVASATK